MEQLMLLGGLFGGFFLLNKRGGDVAWITDYILDWDDNDEV